MAALPAQACPFLPWDTSKAPARPGRPGPDCSGLSSQGVADELSVALCTALAVAGTCLLLPALPLPPEVLGCEEAMLAAASCIRGLPAAAKRSPATDLGGPPLAGSLGCDLLRWLLGSSEGGLLRVAETWDGQRLVLLAAQQGLPGMLRWLQRPARCSRLRCNHGTPVSLSVCHDGLNPDICARASLAIGGSIVRSPLCERANGRMLQSMCNLRVEASASMGPCSMSAASWLT